MWRNPTNGGKLRPARGNRTKHMTRVSAHSGAALCLVWAMAACTGGAPPNDIAAAQAQQDLQTLEARRAALLGGAAPTTPQPSTPQQPAAAVSALPPPVFVAGPAPAPRP